MAVELRKYYIPDFSNWKDHDAFETEFAAYVGAFFNLNPFIERDGYHMLVDWLRDRLAAALA